MGNREENYMLGPYTDLRYPDEVVLILERTVGGNDEPERDEPHFTFCDQEEFDADKAEETWSFLL